MKFTVKGLIALFVTSSTLFLMPMRSDAKVNMKTLAEVADSCQKDVFSESYYQKMRLNFSNEVSDYFQSCIAYRYQYSLVLDKFPWLAYKEEIMPGYPGSVVVAILALDGTTLLDCIASRVAPSEELCSILIALGYRIQDRYIGDWKIYGVGYFAKYLIYVCPSCVVAHDEVSGSKEVILKAFIEWVLKLDKPQRREVFSILGDDDKARQLRESLKNESMEAVQEYQETRARVEQQEQERRKQELLGN